MESCDKSPINKYLIFGSPPDQGEQQSEGSSFQGFSMLHSTQIAEGLAYRNVSLSCGKGVSAETQSVRSVIENTLNALEDGSLEVNSQARSLSGLIQELRSIHCESKYSLSSTDLWRVIKRNLHDPGLQPLAVHLLQGLESSASPLAEKATHELRVLRGETSSASELLESALMRMAQPANHLSLASALTLATFGGRIARLCFGNMISRAGLSAGQAMLARSLGTAGTIALESALFPVGTAAAHAALGHEFSLAQFNESFLHGAKTMSALGAMGALSRGLYHAAHGVQITGQVTRLHRWAIFNRSALPLAGEAVGLTSLSYFENPHATGIYHLLSTLETMGGLRMARSITNGLFPGLENSLSILAAKAHFEYREEIRKILPRLPKIPRGNHFTEAWAFNGEGAIAKKPSSNENPGETLDLNKVYMVRRKRVSSQERRQKEIAKRRAASTRRSEQAALFAGLKSATPEQLVDGLLPLASSLSSFSFSHRVQALAESRDTRIRLFRAWSTNRSVKFAKGLGRVIEEGLTGLPNKTLNSVGLIVNTYINELAETGASGKALKTFGDGAIIYIGAPSHWQKDRVAGSAVYFKILLNITEESKKSPSALQRESGGVIFKNTVQSISPVFFEGPREALAPIAAATSHSPEFLLAVIDARSCIQHIGAGSAKENGFDVALDQGGKGRVSTYFAYLPEGDKDGFLAILKRQSTERLPRELAAHLTKPPN